MSEDPFGLPMDPDFERIWAELCNTICIECRKPLSEHYYHADCATERSISEQLGKATTAFLEGMAEPARGASDAVAVAGHDNGRPAFARRPVDAHG